MSSPDIEFQPAVVIHEDAPAPVVEKKLEFDPNDPEYDSHNGEDRQYMRDMILGINDGLVSMFLLLLGVAGGGLNSTQILLTGISGAVAGAISMGLGEYVATKSQREVYEGDLRTELEHFKHHRDVELEQVRQGFRVSPQCCCCCCCCCCVLFLAPVHNLCRNSPRLYICRNST